MLTRAMGKTALEERDAKKSTKDREERRGTPFLAEERSRAAASKQPAGGGHIFPKPIGWLAQQPAPHAHLSRDMKNELRRIKSPMRKKRSTLEQGASQGERATWQLLPPARFCQFAHESLTAPLFLSPHHALVVYQVPALVHMRAFHK